MSRVAINTLDMNFALARLHCELVILIKGMHGIAHEAQEAGKLIFGECIIHECNAGRGRRMGVEPGPSRVHTGSEFEAFRRITLLTTCRALEVMRGAVFILKAKH